MDKYQYQYSEQRINLESNQGREENLGLVNYTGTLEGANTGPGELLLVEANANLLWRKLPPT